jgi:hypothetical protein
LNPVRKALGPENTKHVADGLRLVTIDSARFGCGPAGEAKPSFGKRGRRQQMCMSCGCGEPHETHGDRRNIIYADLKKAGDASKISVKEAVRNIEKTLRTKNPRSPAGG